MLRKRMLTQRMGAALCMSALALTALACAEPPAELFEEEGPQDLELTVQQHYNDSIDGPLADHHAMHAVTIPTADAVERYFDDGVGLFEYPDAFRQVGLRLQAEDVKELSFRVQLDEERWTSWEPVDVYWSEEDLHNGLILLSEPVTTLELRGLEGLTFAQIEFFPEIIARAELIRSGSAAPDVQVPSDLEEDIRTTTQAAVAPSSMVTSRAQWGATNPSKICGNIVTPYRMSIHHTAVPSSDGSNLYATMRGMQNYHINNNGWCDIGYHFVVAQSGEILQGRSRANRPGAHVANQNAGNVGISMIGNYSSNNPPTVQINKTAEIVRWVHDTYNVPLNRTAIKGHREWPGQWTSCPGDRGIANLNTIINKAAQGSQPPPPPPPPPPVYDAQLRVLISGLDNFYTQGTSENVPDAFEGQEFTAQIRLTNKSDAPIRGVTIGYEFGPGIVATNYRIETDHPGHNQNNWQLNDANDAEGNPGRSNMGSSGTLIMHAFSPNETKRVVITLKAEDYNIGIGNFAGVRAWVRNIDDVYAQGSYGASPSPNLIGSRLRDHKRVDILSRNEWRFQSPDGEDLEGWTAEGPYERLAVNTTHKLLAFKVEEPGAAVLSPSWTSVDADRYDQVVIRVRSHDGDHTKALYWARDGEEFDERRSVRFEAVGDSEYHTMVLPVGLHPEWSGEITGLRLVLNEDLETGEEDSRWYDMDYLYFQNGSESTSGLGVLEQEPAFLDLGLTTPRPMPGFRNNDDGGGKDTVVGGETAASDSNVSVRTNSGCSASGSSTPGGEWLLAALVLGLVAVRRRH